MKKSAKSGAKRANGFKRICLSPRIKKFEKNPTNYTN